MAEVEVNEVFCFLEAEVSTANGPPSEDVAYHASRSFQSCGLQYSAMSLPFLNQTLSVSP